MTPKPPTSDTPVPDAVPHAVPDANELTRSERPGGAEQMPSSSRARPQRKESNSTRDSNDLGSGVST